MAPVTCDFSSDTGANPFHDPPRGRRGPSGLIAWSFISFYFSGVDWSRARSWRGSHSGWDGTGRDRTRACDKLWSTLLAINPSNGPVADQAGSVWIDCGS